jgi:hypothetical protein
LTLDKNHIRLRDGAKTRPLNIPKDKLDYLEKVIVTGKYVSDKTKLNLIKRISSFSPCCFCKGIPTVELSFQEYHAKVVEYYCDSCLKIVFEREKLEPSDKDQLPSYYHCVKGEIEHTNPTYY